jgi:HSP20 family protein
MTETDAKYEVDLTLPGFDAKQVQVTATPSEIIVHAQYKPEKKEQGKVLWSEFGTNDVYRHFETPQPIDVDKAHATLDKGILHVTAAKAAAAKPKPIQVAAA